MTVYGYRNKVTHQVVWPSTPMFAGNPRWDELGTGAGDVSQAELDVFESDTTGVHGIADTAALETIAGATHKVEDGIFAHTVAADPHHSNQYTDAAVAAVLDDAVTAATSVSVPLTQRGAIGGVATLDGSAKLTAAQLPLGTTGSTVAAGNDSRIVNAVGKGDLVLNVKDFGALGTGAGNDAPAIQAAIDATQSGALKGGTVLLPPGNYRCTSPLDATGAVALKLEGRGGRSAGSGVATVIQYAGADLTASFIDLRSSFGTSVTGMMVLTPASYTGRIFDVRGVTGGGDLAPAPAYVHLDNMYVGGTGGTAVGVDLDKATRITLSRLAFYGLLVGVRGQATAGGPDQFANQVTVRECGFNLIAAAGAGIRNPNQAWSVRDCTFEGSGALGTANAMDHDAGIKAEGLVVSGCWTGDTITGTQFVVAGDSITFTGNWIGATTSVGIEVDEATTGLVISGNKFVGCTTAINLTAVTSRESIHGNTYDTVATRLAGTLSRGAVYGDHASLTVTVGNPLARPNLGYSLTHEVQTNLATNGSFDANTAGWLDTTAVLVNSGATLTRITTDAPPLGNAVGASLQVDYDNSANQRGTWQEYTGATATTTYYLTAYVKAVSGRPVKLRIRDTTNNITGTDSTATAVGDGWVELHASITTGGSGSVTLQLSVVTDATTANGRFLLDEVRYGTDVAPAEPWHLTLLRRALASTGIITDQTIA